MALTYVDSAALMTNGDFISRVKVACLKFAAYIQGESIDTPGHSSRLRWAQTTTMSPDLTAQQVTPPVVMDNQVQQDGVAITDTALQTSVETVVNKLI